MKLTLGLFGSAVLVAMLLDDLGLAYAFVGSCSTMLNTQVLPPFIGMMCCKEKNIYRGFFALGVLNFMSAAIANLYKIILKLI